MTEQEQSGKRWNLFARELEDILATHHFSIGQLDDQVGIHREKVRRLKQSLLTPKSFPVLNTEEMEVVSKKLQLSDSEIMRLRAAVLATSIERMLMDRINRDDALVAAEQMFPLISKAMQEQVNSIIGMGAIRREDTISSGYDESDLALESAIEAIEKGTIALHLSYNVSSHTERIERAKEARHHFEVAQAELDEVDDDMHVLASWNYCHNETQNRLVEVNERLEDLGE
jgi:uncharacterized small protein (DUF1192 family)